MKNKTIIGTLFVALALVAAVASAQPRRTVANLPAAACTAGNIENHLFVVTDGDTVTDCTSGGGTVAALCVCDGGIFAPLAGADATDLAAYAPLAGAAFTGPVTIVSDNGGKNTILLGDDGDAEWSVTGGDGLIVRVNCDGGACSFAVLTDGLTSQLQVSPEGVFAQGPLGCVDVAGLLYCTVSADAPFTCTASGTPGYYTDTTGPDLCYCDGTNGWVPVDGSGTCSTAE